MSRRAVAACGLAYALAASCTGPDRERPVARPSAVEIWPWPGAAADYRPTTLRVTARSGRVEARDGATWPARGVWPSGLLGRELGAVVATWHDGDAARRRILDEDYPALQRRLGTLAVELTPVVRHAADDMELEVDLRGAGFLTGTDERRLVRLSLEVETPSTWRFAIDAPTLDGPLVLDALVDLGELRETADREPAVVAHLRGVRLRSPSRKEVLYDSLAPTR